MHLKRIKPLSFRIHVLPPFCLVVAFLTLLSSCGEDSPGGVIPIDPSVLAITAMEPSSGRSGQEILIKGRNFGTNTGYVQVFFSGTSARVLSLSDQEISVVVPAGAETGKVTVRVLDTYAESGGNFTIDNSSALLLDARPRFGAVSFVIGSKAYVGTGRVSASVLEKDFWEFDPAASSWKQLADVPGPVRGSAFSFVIDGVGYVGGGDSSGDTHSMWAYDAATDTWTQKTPYPNDWNNIHATAVTLGGKAYVGFGGSNFRGSGSFYVYDPVTDQWTSKSTNYPGAERFGAVSFVLNDKIYLGLGFDNNMKPLKDFYAYDPATDAWTRLADFAGAGKWKAAAFVLGGKAYVGTGYEKEEGSTQKASKDMWVYTPASDSWTQVRHYGGSPRYGMTAFVIGETAYMGHGFDMVNVYNDFWMFRP